jgi:hypothetical protein
MQQGWQIATNLDEAFVCVLVFSTPNALQTSGDLDVVLRCLEGASDGNFHLVVAFTPHMSVSTLQTNHTPARPKGVKPDEWRRRLNRFRTTHKQSTLGAVVERLYCYPRCDAGSYDALCESVVRTRLLAGVGRRTARRG